MMTAKMRAVSLAVIAFNVVLATWNAITGLWLGAVLSGACALWLSYQVVTYRQSP